MPKTQAEIDLEYMQSKYGKNELLHQALDRAVLRGAMRVEAVPDAMDLFGDKCTVDPAHLDVTLNGLSLDAAVEKLIEDRPLWRPQGPDPTVVAQKELEAAALAGNVSAHGRLFKSMGKVAYDQWRAKHAAQPGKAADEAAAAAAAAAGADDKTRDNPWLAGNWNATRQGQIVRSLGIEAAQRIAKAANSHVGATRPAKVA
jgi:hypothetical protein